MARRQYQWPEPDYHDDMHPLEMLLLVLPSLGLWFVVYVIFGKYRWLLLLAGAAVVFWPIAVAILLLGAVGFACNVWQAGRQPAAGVVEPVEPVEPSESPSEPSLPPGVRRVRETWR